MSADIEIDTDTEAEDRGDNFTPTAEDIAKADADKGESDEATERDKKGRFVKQDKTDDGEVGETDEDEVEEVDEEEEEEAPVTKVKPKSVPYDRFKEVIDERKADKARIAELEAANKAATKAETNDAKERADKLDELYEKVEEARADGDTKTAAQLQRQIDKANADNTKAEATADARRETAAAQFNMTYNGMLDHLELVRPVINPNAPEFDARIVEEIELQVRAYQAIGMSAPQALRRAAALIFEDDPFATGAAAKAPAVAVTKKTDVAKNLAAAKKTPPSGSGRSSNDDGKIVVSKLSDDEFDKLPESKKRELRGDDL